MLDAPDSPFSRDYATPTQAPDLFSLVDLRLIEGEDNTHWHYNPITECYNQCHDEDGKFCSGPGTGLTGRSTLPDKDGTRQDSVPAIVPRGKHGGSLLDPHDGTQTIDGVRGYDRTGNFDKNGKPGKPVPGTDAWLEAHGLDRKTFESRPYVKYEADRGDPALAEAYKDYPQADRFFKKSAAQEGQQGGYIMIKHQVPGSPFGPVPPQIRPNKDLITDQRVRAQKQVSYDRAVSRLEVLKEITAPEMIRERKERLKQAELNLERIKTATPETVRKEADDNLADAHAGLMKAKESGTPDAVLMAKKNLVNAQRQHIKETRRANKWDAEHELYDAETSVKWAKVRLEKGIADPKAALLAEIKTQESTVKRAKKALDTSAAKYVFAPGTTVARIEMHPDPLNVKNLTEGKGRIYFAMEGSIKNDAIFTALKKEDPTASVVNVPSVTLWQEKGGNAREIQWFAEKYGKGREVVLIPDADGINNPAVMQQANGMSAALKTFGFKSVLLASPPLKPGTKYVIDKFKLPSGRDEERKGIDDHLGAGRGTLGQLEFTRNVKTPSYDLSWAGKAEAKAAGGVGINKNSIERTERALAAISSIVGPGGTSRITKNILAQASGLPQTSAKEARDRLEKLGIISVEHIFDEQALSRGKRIRNPKVSDARVEDLVRAGVIAQPRDQLFTDANFDQAPVITLRDSRYLIKHADVDTGTLSQLESWNPPKSFKGWTSPITKGPDTTGIAARQVEAQAKTAAKRAANKSLTTQANRDADVKSSLERKVAAPGRRLVRTPEGARRYGVPIGSPIPIFASETASSVAAIIEARPEMGFSMVLGLIEPVELVNSEVWAVTQGYRTEFYNSCHDEEGKFCPTGGSGISGKSALTGNSKWRLETVDGSAATEWTGSWPLSSGRPVATIAEKRFGSVTINGIKAKAVYEVTAANGNKVRLYDKTGKAGPYASDLLNNHARMNEMYPLKPTRNLIVSKFGAKDQNTFASVHHGDRATYVNADRLGYDISNLRRGFQMPSSHTGNTTNHDYILTHEYGHHVDFDQNVLHGVYIKHPLVYNQSFVNNMSRYGTGQESNGLERVGTTDTYRSIESYAEAFAEWHHSNGTTRNPAAIALARSESWYGTEKDRKAMAAAGNWEPADVEAWYQPLFETTAQNLVQFGDLFSFAVEEGDDEMEFELPAPGKGGIGVADDFESGEATVLGDFESQDATDEEIARADAIMQAVLKELDQQPDRDAGESLSLLSLVDLMRVEGRGQPPFDSEIEFYNQCHGEDDGRFCEGGGAVSGQSSYYDNDAFMPKYEGDYQEGLKPGTQEWYDDNARVNKEAWWNYTEAEEGSYEKGTNDFYKKGPLREAYKDRTPEEAAAFKNYQNDSYLEVNDHLFGKPMQRTVWDNEKNEPVVETYEISNRTKETITNMDAAFSTKGTRPGEGMFWRGITNPEEYGEPVDLSKYAPGTVITHDGFMSTSISKDLTETKPDNNSALIRIRTSNDSDVSTHLGKQTEKEVIFNRGTSLYIRNQYQDRDGRTVIDAEIV